MLFVRQAVDYRKTIRRKAVAGQGTFDAAWVECLTGSTGLEGAAEETLVAVVRIRRLA